MVKLYQVVTVFPAVVRALGSMTPSPASSVAPSPILYANFSSSGDLVTVSSRKTVTLTVLPLPKTTEVLRTNGTAATSDTTTCDEATAFTITTSVGYADVPLMSKGGDMSFSLSPLSSATPATLPGSQLDAVTAAGHTTVNTEDPSPVLSTGHDTSKFVDTSATEPDWKPGATAISTIRLTSTVTVVVATDAADEPMSPDPFPSAITASNKVYATEATDDPFPEPFATMPPNVPPYVEGTTGEAPTITSTKTADTAPVKVANVVTETAVVTLTEIFSTVTKMVTVCISSCLPPTPLQTSLTIPNGNEANGGNGVFAAQTADIIGPLPTVYKPVYNNLNTLLTLSISSGTRATVVESETQSTTDGVPTFTPSIFDSGAANGVYMGYATLLIGLVIGFMLV